MQKCSAQVKNFDLLFAFGLSDQEDVDGRGRGGVAIESRQDAAAGHDHPATIAYRFQRAKDSAAERVQALLEGSHVGALHAKFLPLAREQERDLHVARGSVRDAGFEDVQ